MLFTRKSIITAYQRIKKLIPISIINKLKSSDILVQAYKKQIRKAGLSGSLMPWKLQKALYTNHKEIAALEAQTNIEDFSVEFQVVILGKDSKLIETTLEGIKSSNIQPTNIFIFCKSCNQLQVDDSFKELPLLPTFIIQAGCFPFQNSFAMMLSKINSDLYYYSDIEVLSKKEEMFLPEYYGDWDPDLQLSAGYVKGVVLAKSCQFIKLHGKSLSEMDLSTLISYLYTSGQILDKDVTHIPSILFKYIPDLKLNHNSLTRKGFEYQNVENINKLMWGLDYAPRISLIIPTYNGKDLVKTCIESIINKTKYINYEILLVDNNSNDPDSLEYFDILNNRGDVKLLKYPHEFNYSAINNFAVNHSSGEVIGLINNDVEVISPTWLDYMVGHVMRDEIGCVGSKLLYPDDTIQHAGVVLGYGGGAGHAHKYFSKDEHGYLDRLIATNCYSAVTAACLLVTKKDYMAVGGLNETDLTVAFNDVDFCLKVRELGRRNLYCAEAELYHHESISRGSDVSPAKKARFEKELKYLQMNWGGYIEADPCYNPWLTLKHENFSLKALHAGTDDSR